MKLRDLIGASAALVVCLSAASALSQDANPPAPTTATLPSKIVVEMPAPKSQPKTTDYTALTVALISAAAAIFAAWRASQTQSAIKVLELKYQARAAETQQGFQERTQDREILAAQELEKLRAKLQAEADAADREFQATSEERRIAHARLEAARPGRTEEEIETAAQKLLLEQGAAFARTIDMFFDRLLSDDPRAQYLALMAVSVAVGDESIGEELGRMLMADSSVDPQGA